MLLRSFVGTRGPDGKHWALVEGFNKLAGPFEDEQSVPAGVAEWLSKQGLNSGAPLAVGATFVHVSSATIAKVATELLPDEKGPAQARAFRRKYGFITNPRGKAIPDGSVVGWISVWNRLSEDARRAWLGERINYSDAESLASLHPRLDLQAAQFAKILKKRSGRT